MGFLDKLLSREPPSKDIAKRRLRLALVHDRQPLSPSPMQTIKEEIIEAISTHVEIDKDKTDIALAQSAGCPKLFADRPILGRGRGASSR